MSTLLFLLPLDHASLLYWTLFSVLILSGIGLPVPEEATLFLGGYLAYLEFLKFWPTVYVLIAGIVVADCMGYVLGRFAFGWVFRHVERSTFASFFYKKANWYFEKHGEKVVFFSRPLVGVRVAVPILAGHFRMNFAKFFMFNLLGAVPWTFLLVSLSFYVGSGLDLITEAGEIKQVIYIVLGTLLAVYFVRKSLGIKHGKVAAAPANGQGNKKRM